MAPPKRSIRIVFWMRLPPGVAKLTLDGCSRGNPMMDASASILYDHWGAVWLLFSLFLAISRSFILSLWQFVRLLCAWGKVRLGHGGFLDSFPGPVRWDYAYLLRRVCALIPSSPISIRPVFREATSVVDFLANWVYTHRVSRHFLYSRDLLAGLSSILYLDAQTVP